MSTIARNTEVHAMDPVEVAGAVDTHRDTHTAAAIDGAGRVLGHHTFTATGAGYRALLGWLRSWGTVLVVGVEGTGAHGAGLAEHLRAHGIEPRWRYAPWPVDTPP